jgi:hypothetical protein
LYEFLDIKKENSNGKEKEREETDEVPRIQGYPERVVIKYSQGDSHGCQYQDCFFSVSAVKEDQPKDECNQKKKNNGIEFPQLNICPDLGCPTEKPEHGCDKLDTFETPYLGYCDFHECRPEGQIKHGEG